MVATSVTVVAPDSVRTWYRAFANPDEPVLFVGEEPGHVQAIVDAVLGKEDPTCVRLFSSHQSLARDREVAARLAAAGLSVRVQSETAMRAGLDKAYARHLLAMHGVPLSPWGIGRPTGRDIGALLRKARNSTQSQGIAWARPDDSWGDDVYWEQYVAGTEYSVVVYREAGATTILPPVWKGDTRRDLLPPWKRLRLCPPPPAPTGVLEDLVDIARTVADAIDAWGFAEVEFVAAPQCPTMVLEVNPRICGTMRIAAMAARVSIFDGRQLPGDMRHHEATAYAGELPYQGPAILEADVIATSRITCRASSPGRVRELLEAYGGAAHWPEAW